MGTLLIVLAILVFILGFQQSSLLAIVLYPLAIVALIAGIGLNSLKGRINQIEKQQKKDYDELLRRIVELENTLGEQEVSYTETQNDDGIE